MMGSIGMTITLAILVFTFADASADANGDLSLGDYGTLALVAANAYVVMFNFSWGPVMWVLKESGFIVLAVIVLVFCSCWLGWRLPLSPLR